MEIEKFKNEITLSKGSTEITIKEEEDAFNVAVEGNINIVLKGNISVTLDGQINIVSLDGANIDTIGSKIYLNSRMAKQIFNLPESIEHRSEVEKRLQLIEKEFKKN